MYGKRGIRKKIAKKDKRGHVPKIVSEQPEKWSVPISQAL